MIEFKVLRHRRKESSRGKNWTSEKQTNEFRKLVGRVSEEANLLLKRQPGEHYNLNQSY